ncbi:MAG TPA: hypothetical protein VG502_03275 [Flexivirga sp.]|uniref:hypothetical protein n=1 Tax=Flexivirga sp. TaxID=1962927 RepID=UPI002C5C98A5|nr:hypothetical protein [Flexivirga sp.]HWC21299.1 hypothetical protein [Flexivirga sp.]
MAILPAVTSAYGDRGWPAIALGISIGGTTGVISELGWGVNGPSHVARARPAARARLYVLSLVTQAAAALPISILSALAGFLISEHFRIECALTALATCWAAMSPSWFFIGSGEPSNIVRTDSIPKVSCTLAAAAAIALGAPLWVYPLGLLTATAIGLTVGMRLTGAHWHMLNGFGLRRVVRVFEIQWLALQSTIASAIYIGAPTTIVGMVAPGALGIFSAADRLQRMLLSLLQSVPQAFQNWVGSAPSPAARRERAIRAVKINSVIGALCGGAFVVVAPIASRILFTGHFTISWRLASACAVVVFCTTTSRAAGKIGLVIFRRLDVLRTSSVAGAGVGVVMLLTLPTRFGAMGGLLAVAAAEATVLGIQLLGLRRAHLNHAGIMREDASMNTRQSS